MLYQQNITELKILSRKLEFQLEHSRYAVVGIQATGIVSVLILLWFQVVHKTVLLSWAAGMFVLALNYSLRLGSSLHRDWCNERPSRVHWELIVGGVLLGFSWVASIFWLNTFLSDQYFYLSLLIVIVCYMAILAVSAVVPGVYLAQIFSVYVPIAVWLGWHYDERAFNLVMVILLAGVSLVMSLASGWMSQSVSQLVVVNLERAAMADDLANLSMKMSDRNAQLEQARKQLADLAIIDELTGLRNRRGAKQVFDVEISRATRAGTPLGILMLDVDYFKLYNDTYGHPAGDSVLQKVAEVLLSVTARAGELAVRMGGEEFMLILPGATQRDVMNIAEVIQKRLADAAIEHRTSPIASILTVSQGVVSCVPRLHSEAADMIEAADKALYSSKNSGRNRATLSPYEP